MKRGWSGPGHSQRHSQAKGSPSLLVQYFKSFFIIADLAHLTKSLSSGLRVSDSILLWTCDYHRNGRFAICLHWYGEFAWKPVCPQGVCLYQVNMSPRIPAMVAWRYTCYRCNNGKTYEVAQSVKDGYRSVRLDGEQVRLHRVWSMGIKRLGIDFSSVKSSSVFFTGFPKGVFKFQTWLRRDHTISKNSNGPVQWIVIWLNIEGIFEGNMWVRLAVLYRCFMYTRLIVNYKCNNVTKIILHILHSNQFSSIPL